MNDDEINNFEAIQGQLSAFYTEVNTLVKKNPNDAVNKFKLGLVNSLLTKANDVLGAGRQPFEDFETFDEETIPTTSDVMVIIAQYLDAFEKLKTENVFQKGGLWYWLVDGEREISYRTTIPKKFMKK